MRNSLAYIGLVIIVVVAIFVANDHTAQAAPPASWKADAAHLRDNAISFVINTATAETAELVAATTGSRIQIIGFYIESEGTQNVTFLSASTAKTGPLEFADTDSLSMTMEDPPINLTVSEALNMTTTGSVQINGWLVYVLR